jgi:hypothetical protein
MMTQLNMTNARLCLSEFRFQDLFIDELGWNQPGQVKPITHTLNGLTYTFTLIATLGVSVFEVTVPDDEIPNAQTRRTLYQWLSRKYRENILIFVGQRRTQSVWYWVKREGNRQFPRSHHYDRWQDPGFHLGKLSGLLVALSELDLTGHIEITKVVQRVQSALDIERVTKKFYGEFQQLHNQFMAHLASSIPDEKDRRWYTSVLLNRIMFIYFLQRQGLLDHGRTDYLRDKLEAQDWSDDYYGQFLRPLFFEGFALPEGKRSDQAKAVLGDIPYLNGGLFLRHPIEIKYAGQIQLPDQAFTDLYRLLDGYTWHLDDRPGKNTTEINPDVLGYIFEKYINQKAFGAYYTRPEITEYLCEQTIHRLILEKMREIDQQDFGVLPPLEYEDIHELLRKMDGQRALILLRDILPKLSLLDPACGSGAFLVAALETLVAVYQSALGRAEYLDHTALSQYVAGELKGHPDKNYYIRKKIISHNLFGVDIMDEAVEIARLRLFLALVGSIKDPSHLEPLPNIDFNILCGNSLIGLLRVDEAAYQRYYQPGLFSGPVVTYRQMVDEKERLVKDYRFASTLIDDVEELREEIQNHREKAQTTLNQILLNQFDELKIKYEQATWDSKANKPGKPQTRPLQLADIEALQPFHWGYEFDGVMNDWGGFDAIITNPPWEIWKPQAKEFFADYSDLVTKNKMTIKEFEKRQANLVQDPEIQAAWLAYLSRFPHASAYFRAAPHFANQTAVVNNKRTGSDINLYKLFTEQCYNLLREGGLCGTVIPSGIYTDLGASGLRQMLFNKSQLNVLFGLSNERWLFDGVHHAQKFCILAFTRGEQTDSFMGAFRINPRVAVAPEKLDEFLHEEHLIISTDLVRRLSPETLSVMEFNDPLDVQIARKMLAFPLLGDEVDGAWRLSFTSEFHMTNDSAVFRTAPCPACVPLYEGKMIHQFDHAFAGPRYWVEFSEGRKAILGREEDDGRKLDYQAYRLGYRSVASSTNERTMIMTILPKNLFAGHSLNLSRGQYDAHTLLYFVGVFNSFVVDYSLRQRVSANLTMSFVYQLPTPRLTAADPAFQPIVSRAARLICTSPEFDELATAIGLSGHADGATDPVERAKLRAELDGLIAHVYQLNEEELTHILQAFPLVANDVKEAVLAQYQRYTPYRDLLSGNWQMPTPCLITEGKTDWMHIKAAWQRLQAAGQFSHLSLELQEYDDATPMGDAELLQMCKQYAKTRQERPFIFIFDRDNRGIVNQVTMLGQDYKAWGNNVFSLALPVPPHRAAQPEISIELYYTDDAIQQQDGEGRRLFLSDEFDNRTGHHLTENLHCTDRNKYTRSGVIIDNGVFQGRDPKNLAMSKHDFAQHVLIRDAGFDRFDISAFATLLALVEEIVKASLPEIP